MCYISIHALREEGDIVAFLSVSRRRRFLSTPSVRRATGVYYYTYATDKDFYPRPP